MEFKKNKGGEAFIWYTKRAESSFQQSNGNFLMKTELVFTGASGSGFMSTGGPGRAWDKIIKEGVDFGKAGNGP